MPRMLGLRLSLRLGLTALCILAGLAPAFAETGAPANDTAEPQLLEAQTSDTATAASSNNPAAAASSLQFLDKQKSDELLATDLLGMPAMNANNEKIGDVNDLVADHSGKTIAVVIGVGGFLGIGEKDVAIPFDAVRFSRDDNNDVEIVVDVDKAALQAAPDYQSLDEQEVMESSAKSDGGDRAHAN